MPEVKDKMTGNIVAKMSYDDKGMQAANKMAADDPGLMVVDGRNRSQQMYEGGGMTGMSMIGKPQYKEGGKMMYKHGGKTHGMEKMGHGGMMKKYEEGGKALKEVDSSENPGLSKLPKEVRNKMGYMEKGGKAKKEYMKKKSNVLLKSKMRKAAATGAAKAAATGAAAAGAAKGLTKAKKEYIKKKSNVLLKSKMKKMASKKATLKQMTSKEKLPYVIGKGKLVEKQKKKMKKGGKTKTYLEIMQEGIRKQKANIKKGVKKQKKFDVDSGIKKRKKFDVDSGIKKQKKFKVDSGVKLPKAKQGDYKNYLKLQQEALKKYKKNMSKSKKTYNI